MRGKGLARGRASRSPWPLTHPPRPLTAALSAQEGGGVHRGCAPMADLGDFASMFGLLQTWDTDGDGYVTSEEFQQGLQSLGFSVPQVVPSGECAGRVPSGAGGSAWVSGTPRFSCLSQSINLSRPPLCRRKWRSCVEHWGPTPLATSRSRGYTSCSHRATRRPRKGRRRLATRAQRCSPSLRKNTARDFCTVC